VNEEGQLKGTYHNLEGKVFFYGGGIVALLVRLGLLSKI